MYQCRAGVLSKLMNGTIAEQSNFCFMLLDGVLASEMAEWFSASAESTPECPWGELRLGGCDIVLDIALGDPPPFKGLLCFGWLISYTSSLRQAVAHCKENENVSKNVGENISSTMRVLQLSHVAGKGGLRVARWVELCMLSSTRTELCRSPISR